MKRLFCFLLICIVACQKQQQEPTLFERAGVLEFNNQAKGRNISQYGETVGCTVKTLDVYTLELVCDGDQPWAVIEKGGGNKGFNSIRIKFNPNDGETSRTAELFIEVVGYERVSLAVFNQSVILTDMERNRTINSHMHQRLLKEYLWAQEYSKLEVDLNLDYTQFLNKYLLMLDDVNIEDGGWTKGLVANLGERFIYSNIVSERPVAKSVVQNAGLGFGPFFASALNADGSVYCLAVSYVHDGSPADVAGLCRGDAIYMVDGEYVTGDNYEDINKKLSSSSSGTYSLKYFRNAEIGDGNELTASVAAGVYDYNPVLLCDVLQAGSDRIGYLVLESFDYDSQSFLTEAVDYLKSECVTQLVLDLRFNAGGSVAQSRWLSSCLAGSRHLDDVFATLEYNDSKEEVWKFRGGPDDYDGMGIGPDLGLNKVYVIGSYYTASASEMVVNALRGIDFDVCLIGGRTEGKNVGMSTSYVTVDGVRYLFSPITFRICNAKGMGNYADGLVPDVQISDQDLDFNDGDIDTMFPFSFGDWTVPGANPALDIVLNSVDGADAQVRSLTSVIPIAACNTSPCHGRYGSVVFMKQ